MKPYLTIDECKSIIDLINSSDEETQTLGLNILISKSFKMNAPLRTAAYNAQCILSAVKKGVGLNSSFLVCRKINLKYALHRYLNLFYNTPIY